MSTCANKTNDQQNIDHIVRLIRDKFISIHKILLQVDPIQADNFRKRNGGQKNCCSSSSIMIPVCQLTPLQRIIYDCTTVPFLLSHLDQLLTSCYNHYEKVKNKGLSQNLGLTSETEKILINQIVCQTTHRYLLQYITRQYKRQSKSQQTSANLWATPATWYQSYPNCPLNLLQSLQFSYLFTRGWAFKQDFCVAKACSVSHLFTIMERNGQFQILHPKKVKYLASLKNAFHHSEIKCLFLSLYSLPFQINQKNNRYCTVTEDIQVLFYKDKEQDSISFSQETYIALVPLNKVLTVQLQNKQTLEKEKIEAEKGSLIVIDSSKLTMFYEAENVFMLRKIIKTLTKNI